MVTGIKKDQRIQVWLKKKNTRVKIEVVGDRCCNTSSDRKPLELGGRGLRGDLCMTEEPEIWGSDYQTQNKKN